MTTSSGEPNGQATSVSHIHHDDDVGSMYECVELDPPSPNRDGSGDDHGDSMHLRRLLGGVQTAAHQKREVNHVMNEGSDNIPVRDKAAKKIRARREANVFHDMLFNQAHNQSEPVSDRHSVGYSGLNSTIPYLSLIHI